jgi:hypothetical protein
MANSAIYKPTRVYNHTQSTAASTWTITYPFTGIPVVDAMVDIGGTLTKIMPQQVIILSSSSVELIFTEAFSGIARVVA